MGRGLAAAFLALTVWAAEPKIYTYVGDLGPDFVLLAWGTATGEGSNTIGRGSERLGKARVQLGTQVAEPERNWVRIGGLAEDTAYDYRLWIDGRPAGEGTVRTWPRKSEKLAFLALGDFGTGGEAQLRVAKAMTDEVSQRSRTDNPIRFVITTGDNIYGQYSFFRLRYVNTGADDADWGPKFFAPYEYILKSVPFYPALGNHDGNMTEARGDLTAYLDNFFFPGGRAARYYTFSYGGLADFFALDTSNSSEEGRRKLMYGAHTEQDGWLAGRLERSAAPWKIPYFHHPVLTAGPTHEPEREKLADWLKMFEQAGVKVVFSGHEHNLQISAADAATGGIRYIVTGAGGALRTGNIESNMQREHIEGWAPQHHFLVVTIAAGVMEIQPRGPEAIVVRNAKNEKVEMPLRVRLR